MKINRKAPLRIGVALCVVVPLSALCFYSFTRFVQDVRNPSAPSLALSAPFKHFRGVARSLTVKDLSYIRVCLEDRADTVDVFVPSQFQSALKPLINGPSLDFTCVREPIPNSPNLRYTIAAFAVASE